MIQEIITFFILLITLGVAIRNTLRFFTTQTTKCNSCAMSASGCKIAEMKKKRHHSAL